MWRRTEFIKRCFGDRLLQDKHRSGYPFVTISRQAGAGGHTLAEELLQRTQARAYEDLFRDWKLFDRELCAAILDQPDLRVSMESLLREEYHSAFEEFVHDMKGDFSPQYAVYRRMIEMIRVLGSIGKVVIIGRGSVIATRHLPGRIAVRLLAPKEVRVQNIAKFLNFTESQARHYVETYDEERIRFARDFFGANLEDPANYDLVCDTSQVSLASIAERLEQMIVEKDRVLHPSGAGGKS